MCGWHPCPKEGNCFEHAVNHVGDFFNSIGEHIGNLLNSLVDLGACLINKFGECLQSDAFQWFTGWLEQGVNFLGEKLGGAANGLLEYGIFSSRIKKLITL